MLLSLYDAFVVNGYSQLDTGYEANLKNVVYDTEKYQILAVGTETDYLHGPYRFFSGHEWAEPRQPFGRIETQYPVWATLPLRQTPVY